MEQLKPKTNNNYTTNDYIDMNVVDELRKNHEHKANGKHVAVMYYGAGETDYVLQG